jgi:hypothetical protein
MAQRFALVVSVSLMLGACATISPPRPPSLNLPQAPTDLRAKRKGNQVTLTWKIPTTTTDRETIRKLGSTLICRGPGELTACGTRVGETTAQAPPVKAANQKPAQGTYNDNLPAQLESDDPSASITYAVQVTNPAGRSAGLSNQVKVSLVRTLSPPADLQAKVTKQGVVLSWTGEAIPSGATQLSYVYRVYRRAEGSPEQALVGEVSAEGGENRFRITDSGIEWEKTYYYHAETVTRASRDATRLDVEGDDTPEIKVFADDVFPPEVPSDLQAVFSGPGQKPFIDLVWAPVSDADLAGYNVYRHEEGAAPVKLNKELIKAPAYRDESVASGKKYFYSVSAVDIRGNESARSEEASEMVP